MPDEKIINTFDQLVAAGGGVAIVPTTIGTSRAEKQVATHWLVIRVVNGKLVDTDPKAAWYFHGRKAFGWFAGTKEKANALKTAQAWILKTYGINGPWTRNRLGDYVPTIVNKTFPIPKREQVPDAATTTP